MKKWSNALVFALLMIASPVQAQQDEEKKADHLEGISFGFKIKGGFEPNFWTKMSLGNFPDKLRTIDFGFGPSQISKFEQHGADLRIGDLIPIHLGLTLNFGNRVQLSGGGAITFNPISTMECDTDPCGNFFDFFEVSTTSGAIIGGFSEASVRVGGPFWFTTEVSSYPIWNGINFRQGRHALDDLNPTLPDQSLGAHRIPLIALAGFRFCGACDKDSRAGFGFLAGFAFMQNRMNPEFAGINYSPRQKMFVVEAFMEENIFHFNWSKRKSLP